MSRDKIILNATKRELKGKKLKSLRTDGIVPAVVYGRDREPIDIQIEMGTLLKVITEAGTHTPVSVHLDDSDITTIIKSVKRDPVSRLPITVNFQAVSADQVVKTEVPIEIVDEDESDAKKSGLIILQDIERIEIKAKPADLPESLTISARDLKEHGDKLLIKDIIVPSGIELLYEDENLAIASVWEPSAIAAQNAAADEAAKAEAEAEAAETSTEDETSATEGAANQEAEETPKE